ncbi:MAG: response regulator [Actinomycetota bacterium]
MDKQRILVIEDDPMNLRLIFDLLNSEGFTTLTAQTAEEGIKIAKTELPVLIVMDVGLPGLDGIEATRRLKADPKTQEIPIVFVTSYAMNNEREECLKAGAQGYLSKPIDTREFPALIKKLLKR